MNIRARVLVLFAALLAAQTQALADDRADACGYVYPVEGYQADVAGLHITMPANDRLVVNGRVLAEHTRFDEKAAPRPWSDSANVAEVALTQDDVLVRTMWTDCVDYSWSRIYVLDRSGKLRTTSALWSMNDEFSLFSVDAAGLNFSSSWLCGDRNGAPPGRAVVYVLHRGATAFEREERPWDDVCSASARRSNIAIYFSPMRPILARPD